MKEVKIGNKYTIFIGQCLIEELPSIYDINGKVFVITDSNVASYHLFSLKMVLQKKNLKFKFYILKPGENNKNYKTVSWLVDNILAENPDRNSVIISFGGGVIGDLSGFVASILLRGVKLVHIPTTLLAQVDSSIGGKTAVNSVYGKNLIGTFYNPELVLIDIDLLKTLNQRSFVSGMAEVIKYGIIKDIDFLDWIENNSELILSQDASSLKYLVRLSCEIKSEFVTEDFHENCDKRIMLNFGHTFAHALEGGLKYKIFHGEAVSIGMCIAIKVSNELDFIDIDMLHRVQFLLRKFHLPVDISTVKQDLTLSSMLFYLLKDKKNTEERLTLILVEGVGKPVIKKNIKYSLIKNVLSDLF